MNSRNKKAYWSIIIIALTLEVVGGGYGIWSEQTSWSDTGKVSWVGQKSFDGEWHIPFAVTTLQHGTLTFNYPDNQNQLTVTPTAGLLLGVVRYNSGSYRLVVDP